MESDIKKTVEIFWTGGYDSTFRVLQLSRLPIKIRPYYLSDNRKSEQNELSAINNITAILKGRKETQCEILPLEIISKSQRIADETITAAFQRLLKLGKIGSQYEWLGWFAKDHKGIEISVLNSPGTHLHIIIEKLGCFQLVTDEIIGDYYIIDREKSHKDLCDVFEDFHFPLFNMTKLEMKDYYLKWDCKEIMKLTWFCFRPINGKPCGLCNPCKQAISDGLKERFTKIALFRNKLLPVRKVLIKIKKTIL